VVQATLRVDAWLQARTHTCSMASVEEILDELNRAASPVLSALRYAVYLLYWYKSTNTDT
jgi:hypothetical protein